MRAPDDQTRPTGWTDKLSIFMSCMSYEESIRTSYQSLLTGLELGILGLVFTLYQLKLADFLWVLPVAGIILCIFFGVACEFRARNVDYWRNQITALVKKTDLEKNFEEAKYSWVPLGKVGRFGERHFGHWFERILVSFILIIWQISLWLFDAPLIILLLGVLATFFWIIYVFKVVELKGKIITSPQ
jgi:hypothetical protein